MAIFDEEVELNNLITIDDNGVRVTSSFPTIKNALIKLYKKCYGNDIDISPQTADGQYVTEIALVLNNIFNLVKHSQEMMDPTLATGRYLDILASYNNIKRRNASYSKAQLVVKNISGVNQTPGELNFVDRSGNIWKWINPSLASGEKEYTWNNSDVITIDNVTCTVIGAVTALRGDTNIDINDYAIVADYLEKNGDIYQTTDYGTWVVYQGSDAEVGDIGESDAEFRARRVLSLGVNSISILDGVKSSLLNIDGVKDVCVINCPTGTEVIPDDTTAEEHSVYIVVRKENEDLDLTKVIGNTIYNKMTPGIPTIAMSDDDVHGTACELDIKKGSQISQKVYWKECKYDRSDKYNKEITCTFTLTPNYSRGIQSGSISQATTPIEINIWNAIKNHITNITLDDNKIYKNKLLFAINEVSNSVDNKTQFIINSVSLGLNVDEYPLNLSYVNFSEINPNFNYSDDTMTLTFTI